MTGPLTILGETYRVAWGDLVYIRDNIGEVLVTCLVGPLLYLLAFGFGLGGSMEQGSSQYIAFIIPGIIALTLAGTVRALISCTAIMVVGHLISPDVTFDPWVFVVVLVAGFTFSCFGMLAGMLCNHTQRLNLFNSIVIIPMTFLCGTLFDVSALPDGASWVVYALPLTHVSGIMRGLMLDTGVPLDSVLILLAYTAAFFAACYWLIRTNRC